MPSCDPAEPDADGFFLCPQRGKHIRLLFLHRFAIFFADDFQLPFAEATPVSDVIKRIPGISLEAIVALPWAVSTFA